MICRTLQACTWLTLALFCWLGSRAHAQGAPASTPGKSVPEAQDELAGLPAFAGNDTFGFLFGVTGSYTRFAPGYAPFRFRGQLSAVSSVRSSESGVQFPLQNIDLRLDFPGLLAGRMRVFALLRYQRIQNVGYWGVGNGASGTIPADYEGPDDRFFTYEKQLGEGRVFVRYRLIPHLELVTGVGLRLVRPDALEDSRLARDLAAGGAAARLLHGYTMQEVADGLGGLLLDTRDDEFNPRSGSYHELSLRVGGGPSNDGKLLYGSVYLHTRWFFPLPDERLVLALRALGDLGFGTMPLIELGTIGGYASFAGPASIEANRGLPYGRQLGRVKLLSTIELRSTFHHFRFLGQQLALAAAIFVDASRVWSHLGAEPTLDGGPMLRVSFGGGPRLVWGRGLVLRLDVGMSPRAYIDDRLNVSASLALGHVF